MNCPLIDCHTHIGVDPAFYARGHFPYAQDYRSLVDQASRNGVQRLITFPFVSYFGWEGLEISPPQTGGDFSVPYAFENRRMLEEIFELNSDLSHAALPFVIVDPARNQSAQAAELRKLRERFPIFGLKIQATIIQSPVRRFLDEGSCLVDLAAEWNVPMLIHSSIAPDDIWSQAGDILDIAEARPEVRFCLAHSCRFHRSSLERLGKLPNTWFDCSAHAIHCDAAVDDLKIVAISGERLETDYTQPEVVMKALCDFLPDRMMWGSDAPFYSYAATHDGETVRLFSSYEREIAALSLLSATEKSAIMHDNILRFLGVSHV
jgi:predicted TIM-barrel fold metal-dependent hydrolase